METDKIITFLQNFRESYFTIGSIHRKGEIDGCYGNLSRPFKYRLCGQIAEMFKVALEECLSIKNINRIFLYSDRVAGIRNYTQYIYNKHNKENSLYWFDKEYVLAVVNNNIEKFLKYENRVKWSKKESGTHGILEIAFDKVITVDPTAGILYPYSIKQLLKDPNLCRKTFMFNDQYKYQLNSIHMVRPLQLLYATPAYWSHIRSYYYRKEPFCGTKELKEYKKYFRNKK